MACQSVSSGPAVRGRHSAGSAADDGAEGFSASLAGAQSQSSGPLGAGRQPFAVAGSALNHPRAGTYLLIVFVLGRLVIRPPALGDQVALSRSARSRMGSMS